MYFTGGMFSLILRKMPIAQTKLLFHEIFCDLVINRDSDYYELAPVSIFCSPSPVAGDLSVSLNMNSS